MERTTPFFIKQDEPDSEEELEEPTSFKAWAAGLCSEFKWTFDQFLDHTMKELRFLSKGHAENIKRMNEESDKRIEESKNNQKFGRVTKQAGATFNFKQYSSEEEREAANFGMIYKLTKKNGTITG